MNEVARAVLQRRYDELQFTRDHFVEREVEARNDLLRIITKRAQTEAELAELKRVLDSYSSLRYPQFDENFEEAAERADEQVDRTF